MRHFCCFERKKKIFTRLLLKITKINKRAVFLNSDNFAIHHHEINKTRNNCFRSKHCNTTPHQEKTGKHKYVKIAANIAAFVFSCFHLIKDYVMLFLLETTVACFVHLIVFIYKIVSLSIIQNNKL